MTATPQLDQDRQLDDRDKTATAAAAARRRKNSYDPLLDIDWDAPIAGLDKRLHAASSGSRSTARRCGTR